MRPNIESELRSIAHVMCVEMEVSVSENFEYIYDHLLSVHEMAKREAEQGALLLLASTPQE